MMNAITTMPDAQTLEQLLVTGNLAALTPAQKMSYYAMRCEAAGLDPRGQPFQFVNLQGKLVLYATRACTQQLAGKHGISTAVISQVTENELRVVTVRASKSAPEQHTDEIGAVSVKGLAGEALANAYMKAITKAKRRAVLALCGLGEMDETEVESVRGAQPVDFDVVTADPTASSAGSTPPAASPSSASAPEVAPAATSAASSSSAEEPLPTYQPKPPPGKGAFVTPKLMTQLATAAKALGYASVSEFAGRPITSKTLLHEEAENLIARLTNEANRRSKAEQAQAEAPAA